MQLCGTEVQTYKFSEHRVVKMELHTELLEAASRRRSTGDSFVTFVLARQRIYHLEFLQFNRRAIVIGMIVIV